jgi:hypothetical protein
MACLCAMDASCCCLLLLDDAASFACLVCLPFLRVDSRRAHQLSQRLAAPLCGGLAAQFVYSLGVQEPRHICSRVGLPALTARASLMCLVFQLTKARVRLVFVTGPADASFNDVACHRRCLQWCDHLPMRLSVCLICVLFLLVQADTVIFTNKQHVGLPVCCVRFH